MTDDLNGSLNRKENNMSYSIIFETKIAKLSDGRIIHFNRSGCNNDTAGRHKDEFHANIYSLNEFMEKIQKFKENSKPYKNGGDFDLKIGSRYASYYDYGEHLFRMLKRALSYENMIDSMYFRVEYLTGIELLKPEHKIMTVEEFDKIYFDLLYGGKGLTYRRMMEYPNVKDEKYIVSLIEDGKTLEFEIRK